MQKNVKNHFEDDKMWRLLWNRYKLDRSRKALPWKSLISRRESSSRDYKVVSKDGITGMIYSDANGLEVRN